MRVEVGAPFIPKFLLWWIRWPVPIGPVAVRLDVRRLNCDASAHMLLRYMFSVLVEISRPPSSTSLFDGLEQLFDLLARVKGGRLQGDVDGALQSGLLGHGGGCSCAATPRDISQRLILQETKPHSSTPPRDKRCFPHKLVRCSFLEHPPTHGFIGDGRKGVQSALPVS